MSFNQTKSCASCHDPSFAFSDGYRRSATATGELTLRNAPSLLNVEYLHFLNWADSGVVTLEQQHQKPLFAHSPIELGVGGNEEEILSRFSNDPAYVSLFTAAFPREKDPFTTDHLITALAEYVRSLRSFMSPYDRYRAGDSSALNEREKRGMQLFFSARTQCVSCHPPPMFTLADKSGRYKEAYRNIGLYNVGNAGVYPTADRGLFGISGNSLDDGKFRIPSLRNVALTAPYMHDGSVDRLEDVLEIYQAGGRLLTDGPYTGDGRSHPNKDQLLRGFSLTKEEQLLLIDFLHTLTDTTWLSDPWFRAPDKMVSP